MLVKGATGGRRIPLTKAYVMQKESVSYHEWYILHTCQSNQEIELISGLGIFC